MKEYKIYTAYVTLIERGKGNTDIEQKLNDFVKQGYHVISVTSFREHYLAFTLERDIPNEE